MNSATHSVNSNSPFELRDQRLPADSVVPVEPDAWRRACPARRRLVGLILSGIISFSDRVIPTFDPMDLRFLVPLRAVEGVEQKLRWDDPMDIRQPQNVGRRGHA